MVSKEGSGDAQGKMRSMKLKEVARLIEVEAGQIKLDTPLNEIKGWLPKGNAIPKHAKKARLYKMTMLGDKPSADSLVDLGPHVAVPVAVRRAFVAGRVQEGDSLVYAPGEEPGERVHHFRATRELLELGERHDPGEREMAVREEDVSSFRLPASRKRRLEDDGRPRDGSATEDDGADALPGRLAGGTPRRVRRRRAENSGEG